MAVLIRSFSGQAAWHLANEFLARSNHANEGTAIARRQSKTLAFHRDNVCFRGGLYQSQGKGFGHSNNEQCSGGVRSLCDRREVLNSAQEIRRLHNDSADVIPQCRFEPFEI